MTAPVYWWNDRDRPGGADVLLPCEWPDAAAARDDFAAALARDPYRFIDAPRIPPGTLTPDDGETVLLRVSGDVWDPWRFGLDLHPPMWREWRGQVPVIQATDLHTGAPWRITLAATHPAEFRALIDRDTDPVPLTRPYPDMCAEAETLVYARWPHLAPPDWSPLLGRRR